MEIKEFVLKNEYLEVTLLNIGGVIKSIKFDGEDMVIYPDDLNYFIDNKSYQGAVVGRTAGRIREGKFSIDNKEYSLEVNGPGVNLHGNNIHCKFYDTVQEGNKIIFQTLDKEGEYPGDLNVKITYELVSNKLLMEIEAKSNKDTLVNMTNHTHFNINFRDSILEKHLLIPANKVWRLDENLLPIEKIDVKGTPFDFTKLTKIENNKVEHEQFEKTKFIDHPFNLNQGEDIVLYDDKSKRKLIINTNQPYVVCYMGNYLADAGFTFRGEAIQDYQTVCLETQKVPDGINLKDGEDEGILRVGDVYKNITSYEFIKE